MDRQSKAAVIGAVLVLLVMSVLIGIGSVPDLPGEEDTDLNSSNAEVSMRSMGSNSTHEFLVDCDNGVSPWDINSSNRNESRFTENCWVEVFSKSGSNYAEQEVR